MFSYHVCDFQQFGEVFSFSSYFECEDVFWIVFTFSNPAVDQADPYHVETSTFPRINLSLQNRKNRFCVWCESTFIFYIIYIFHFNFSHVLTLLTFFIETLIYPKTIYSYEVVVWG